ncbi:hypothetical protein OAP11_03200 [Bacteroidia bacterium]|nr:hypothetical protein [Bacteroidia bacterium]
MESSTQKINQFITPLKLILILVSLNFISIYIVYSNTKSSDTVIYTNQEEIIENKYIHAGALVLDWSYSMLRYFKK